MEIEKSESTEESRRTEATMIAEKKKEKGEAEEAEVQQHRGFSSCSSASLCVSLCLFAALAL